MTKRFLSGAAVCLLLVLGFAKLHSQNAGSNPSPVTQSATFLNAATKVTNVNTAVNVSTAATLTPSAGNYVYISSIDLHACQSNTGGTAQTNVSWTSTGITGSPAWQYSLVTTANVCSFRQVAFPYPLKSTTAGAAVTIVPPSANTQVSYNINVGWYEAP